MRRRLDAAGYLEVKTPQLMDARQWEAVRPLGQISREYVRRPRRDSGHGGGRADPVRRRRPDGAEADELPGPHPDLPPGHQILSRPADPASPNIGCCHRNEPHGALHGILRVRQFTQDDGHIFCREDQIVEETRAFLRPARLGLPRSRLPRLCDQARAAAGEALRQRRDVGPGRAGSARRGPPRRPRRPRISAGRSCRARAPSIRPSSNST